MIPELGLRAGATGGPGGRDRAQLIVVGALALAVALVALGLVLNFAIYTENLATRDTNPDTRAAVTQQQAAERSVARTLRYVNVHHAGSVSTAQLEAELLRLNRVNGRYSATTGGTTEVEVVDETMGARMAHTNESKAFVDDDGDVDWVLAGGVPKSRTGRFEQTINRSALWEPSLTTDTINLVSNAYHVRIEDNSNGDVWRLFVFQDSDRGLAYLFVTRDDTLPGSTPIIGLKDLCPSRKKDPTLNVTGGTFGDTPCTGLQLMWGSLSSSYDIAYRNTKTFDGDDLIGQAKGEYDIVVGCDFSTCVNDGDFHTVSSGDSPFAYEAFYKATVEVTYETPDVTLRNRVETQPVASTSGFPGVAPTIDTFDVTDNSVPTSKAEYTIDWKVGDRDTDLKKVNVTLVDKDCCVRDFRTYTTSDAELSADGGQDTVTLTHSSVLVTDSDLYVIRITAFDENNNTVSRVKEDDSDGTDSP